MLLQTLLQVLLLIIGFAMLIKGADIFVDGAVGIAERLRVPKIIIGLTIVAIGTSAPEAVISITGSIQGYNELVIGNIVGSNIFNLVFIIGLCAVIKPIAVKVREIHKDFWLSIIAAVLLLALKLIGLHLTGDGAIPWWGSLFLLVVFFAYMVFVVRKALQANRKTAALAAAPESAPAGEALVGEAPAAGPPATGKKPRHMAVIILLTVFGLALIIAGGHFTVGSATFIAEAIGVSTRIIGLTVVAIGTSLPELIISLVACKKGENQFALGNIIGSNIFNILFVLGIAGVISPLDIAGGLILDTIFLIAASTLTIIFVYTSKRIGRREGAIMVLLYLGYMTYAVLA